jgi:thiol-disulfide isomerase/thioredoxin
VSRIERRRDRRERERATRRRQTQRRSIWRGPLPIVAALGAIVVVIAAFVVLRNAGGTNASASPNDRDAVVAAVTSVRSDVYDAVRGGSVTNSLVPRTVDVLRGPGGKPVVVYVGAEYCPYCASERWSLIAALARFGRFSGLTLTMSSSTDVYPNTPTFTFRGSTFSSDVLEFAPVETADRTARPLDSPSPLQSQSYARYDPDGSIPYVSVADRVTRVGSGYVPDTLAGKSWQQIAAQLADPSSPVAKAILGEANYLSASLCVVTNRQPASVCDSASVRDLLPTQ